LATLAGGGDKRAASSGTAFGFFAFPPWKQRMPKVLIVEFCALRHEVYPHVQILVLCSSSPFFYQKNKS
jgi:hypothetical protein